MLSAKERGMGEKSGISILVLTWNTIGYTKAQLDQIRKLTAGIDHEVVIADNGSTDGTVEWLQDQTDVKLWRNKGNTWRHGFALDFLVRKASKPICCTLCSDALPVSPEWTTPASFLDDGTVLAGIDKGWGRKLQHYVCPSYLFGWRDWLSKHSFADRWPDADTGEMLSVECVAEGKKMKLWPSIQVSVGAGFKKKPSDYNGWVWHTWWGSRRKAVPGLAGREFEAGYHERVKAHLKERYGIDVR